MVDRHGEAGSRQKERVGRDHALASHDRDEQQHDHRIHGDALVPAEDARDVADRLAEVEAAGDGDERDDPGEPDLGAVHRPGDRAPQPADAEPLRQRADPRQRDADEPDERQEAEDLLDGGVIHRPQP